MQTDKTKTDNQSSLIDDVEFRKWAMEQAVHYTANHNYTLQSAFNYIMSMVDCNLDYCASPFFTSQRATEILNMQRNAETLIHLIKKGHKPRFRDIILSKEQFDEISGLVSDDPDYLRDLQRYVPSDYDLFTSIK